ncbi:MAG: hypothetical protein ACOYI8_08685 [Christensenellales bacterium]
MHKRRPYVISPDAPAVHARLVEADENAYALNFNGVDILTLRFPSGKTPRYMRPHSDGDFQSEPMTQQFCMWMGEEDVPVSVEFFAPIEMWNMRPRRAKDGEAILGQVGYPLMYGVNGMYLPDWDFLISWYGNDFRWNEKRIAQDDAGFHASMKVRSGQRPWIVLLQPRFYSEHLGYGYYQPWKFRPNPKPITGWCSWEAYHSDVTQADLEESGKALKQLKPYGLEYMQLDDGYQQRLVPPKEGASVADSWLNLNEKFPDGHEGILNAFAGNGFKPAIWTNATITNTLAAQEEGFCMRDREGNVICGDWILYPMICSRENLDKHVIPYYRAFREMGYTYVKSDSLRHLIFDGAHEAVRLGAMSNDEARANQRAYMEAAREGLGSDVYYLSCWGVLTQSIGVCDAMRVGTDSSPRWSSYSMQIRETARWFFAQRVMFTVDPDMVCVRGKTVWARMMLSLVALTGGLFMISDKVAEYDAERLSLIKRTMPGLDTRTAETGHIDYTTPACIGMGGEDEDITSRYISHIDGAIAPFSTLWSTHFDRGGRTWTVVQRVAVVPLDGAAIELSSLALDPEKRYYAFDFWNQKGYIVENGEVRFKKLALGDTAVLALTDISDALPTLVGSDRHVSMDCVSVQSVISGADDIQLTLTGFVGLEAVYTCFFPHWKGTVDAEGVNVRAEKRDDTVRICVAFTESTAFVRLK